MSAAGHDIEHRLTKPYHPWTNGQAERMKPRPAPVGESSGVLPSGAVAAVCRPWPP